MNNPDGRFRLEIGVLFNTRTGADGRMLFLKNRSPIASTIPIMPVVYTVRQIISADFTAVMTMMVFVMAMMIMVMVMMMMRRMVMMMMVMMTMVMVMRMGMVMTVVMMIKYY